MAITRPNPDSPMWREGGNWHLDPPTINAASVGLQPNTIYIDPNTGRIYRTV